MKKMHRFLLEEIPASSEFAITNQRTVHQIADVLQLKIGESCIVFVDNGPDIITEIKEIDRNEIVVEKISTQEKNSPHKKILAAVSIPKGQTFELIVQKLTELGVSEIIPLRSHRTVKQSVRLERLQTISDEALEQSDGNIRVHIHEPMELTDCLKQFPFTSVAFERGAPSNIPNEPTLVMYVGPEGGWSETDKAILETHHTIWCGLGDTTLRTETAAIVGAYELLRK